MRKNGYWANRLPQSNWMHSAQCKKTLYLLMRRAPALVPVPDLFLARAWGLGLAVVRELVPAAALVLAAALALVFPFWVLSQVSFPAPRVPAVLLRAAVPLAAVRRLLRQAVGLAVQAAYPALTPHCRQQQKTMMPTAATAYLTRWMRLLLTLRRHPLQQMMMPLAVYCRRLLA